MNNLPYLPVPHPIQAGMVTSERCASPGGGWRRRGAEDQFGPWLGMRVDAKVKMPSLSPTMTTGTIVKWSKKEGETIASGDVLCEVQTDKAVVAMETDEEGILAKILVSENTPDVPVGRLIALIVDDGKDWQNVEIPAEAKVDAAITIKAESSTPQEVIAKVEYIPGKKKIMGPAARLLLQTYQINAKSIEKGSHTRALLKNTPKHLKNLIIFYKDINKSDNVDNDGAGSSFFSDILSYIQEMHLSPINVSESLPLNATAAPKPLNAKTKSQVVDRLMHFVDVQVSNDRKTKASDFISSKVFV
uniref:Lipoyl-binding domain-containing protein n=1 Tax=Romanomermis culicivorax TaxID=13658 RepID=A0A915I3V2_ROMCU